MPTINLSWLSTAVKGRDCKQSRPTSVFKVGNLQHEVFFTPPWICNFPCILYFIPKHRRKEKSKHLASVLHRNRGRLCTLVYIMSAAVFSLFRSDEVFWMERKQTACAHVTKCTQCTSLYILTSRGESPWNRSACSSSTNVPWHVRWPLEALEAK